MNRSLSPTILTWLACVPGTLFGTFFFVALARPQHFEASPTMRITTQERLQTEAWWPTMETVPLDAYTGSSSCTQCHDRQTSPTATAMQRAATRAAANQFLPASPSTTFHSGGRTYSLAAEKAGLRYTVAAAGNKAPRDVDWVIGAGDLGRTLLYQADGRWYQSEVSFYTHPEALDITTGFGPSTSVSLAGALGNVLSPVEARACFSCHTVHATTPAGLNPQHAEAGIGCEACHGPGRKHVSAMNTRESDTAGSKTQSIGIFDPARLSPADSIDFCGSCHRSFADASLATGSSAERAVVRFQPYRLEESKCWRATGDARLTCVACHDPHQPLNRNSQSYDANCLQCHSSAAGQHVPAPAAAICPKATHDCVTCHMPKVNLPSMHGDFTDHFIRIVRAGEPLPR